MAKSPSKLRLDELLVDLGMVDSRSRAKALIMAGKVRSGTTILDKAGKVYPTDTPIELEQPPRFVGRGGEKLDGFLEKFPLSVEGKTILDVGASTGGFTDCLLQRGAARAVCVDVGHGQLHYKLQKDPRVTNLERVNARHLNAADLPEPGYPVIVMDLSFISLKTGRPAVWPLLEPGGTLIALIKPQFEAGKADADAGGGVIRDTELRDQIVQSVLDWVKQNLAEAELSGFCPSPIAGMSGNQEFLAGWKRVKST